MTSSPTAVVAAGGRARTSGRRARAQTLAVGLGALMASLAQTLVLPVLPEISARLHASATQSQWLLTSTLLVAAVAVPVLTRLADMFGRRLMLVICLLALAVGSTLDALTDNVGVMIAGRALAGLSSAAIPLGISLLAALLPRERQGSAVAVVSAMLGVGGALGLPLAGLVAQHFDFHVLYWIAVAGAASSAVLVRALVDEPRVQRGQGSIDVAGIVLLAGGLICLVLPLSEGSTWGWGASQTLLLFVASVVLLGLLVGYERRPAEPLIDLRAFAVPAVAVTNVASLLVGFALFASFVGTSSYVQAPKATGYGFDSSVLTAGLCLLPSGVLMLALSPVAAKLIDRWGAGHILSLAGVILAIGLIVRIVLVGALWQVIAGSAIVGVGTGIGYACLPSLINSYTPSADLAAANGLNSLARSLGSTLASAAGGSLLAAITISVGGSELPSLTAYRVLFAICTAASLLAAAGGLLLGSGRLAVHRRAGY